MRTRKFKRGVMWACTGVAVLVAAVTAIDIMIPSYYDWKESTTRPLPNVKNRST